MFLQFSPPKNVQKPIKPIKTEPAENVEIVVMRPFSANPKVFFENIKIGTIATQCILVHNPTNQDMQITVKNSPSQELNVQFNWQEILLSPNEKILLEIKWQPRKEESLRHVIHLTSKNLKKDIPIVFKTAVAIKQKTTKPVKPKGKISVLAKKMKTPQKIYRKLAGSPKNRVRPIPVCTVTAPTEPPKFSDQITEDQNLNISSYFGNCSRMSDNVFASPKDQENGINGRRGTYQVKRNNSPIRHQTYILSEKFTENENQRDEIRRDTFRVDKTNTSNRHKTYVVPELSCTNENDDVRRDTFIVPKALAAKPFSASKNTYSVANMRNETFLKENGNITDLRRETFTLSQSVKNLQQNQKVLHMNNQENSPFYDGSMQPRKVLQEICPSTPNLLNNIQNLQFSPCFATKANSPLCSPFLCFEKDALYDSLNTPKSFNDSPASKKVSNKKSFTDLFNASGKENMQHLENDSILTGVDLLQSPISNQSTPDVSGIQMRRLPRNSSPLDQYQFRVLSPHFNDLSYISTMDQLSPKGNKSPRMSELSGYGAKTIIEADLWATPRLKPSRSSICLESIAEETLSSPPQTRAKRKIPDETINVSPPKHQTFQPTAPLPVKRTKTWSTKGFVSVHSASGNHPVLFSAILTDPFLNLTPKDEEWMLDQEIAFNKWLNLLLSAPKELDTDLDSHPLDVASLWQQCKKNEFNPAVSKETVSSSLHVGKFLNRLRTKAKALYNSAGVSDVLKNALVCVKQRDIKVKNGLKIHLDCYIQQELLKILLSYNPLWLRIGLETIFDREIDLRSNSDILGLSKFIEENLFKNARLLNKYKHKMNENYGLAMNKYVFSTFLKLVYFLDCAKMERIIAHNPCLFCRNAPIKESNEILLAFSRLVLSAVDLSRNLKSSGFAVFYKQQYLDEFDYTVTELGLDLRDGVRFTKLMEVILLRNDLSATLRVPAISRLQKIYNVNIALTALKNSGYELVGDIEANHVVDGHREKTMSLLWQLLNKFKAPRMTKAAIDIQRWWKSIPVVLVRRRSQRLARKREESATKIQTWYRSICFARRIENTLPLLRSEFLEQRRKIEATRIIQRTFRSYVIHKKIRSVVETLLEERKMKKTQAAITIQQRFRAYQEMMMCRNYYMELKRITVAVQKRFRANKEMILFRNTFLAKKAAVVILQKRYRATLVMKYEREQFLKLKESTIVIQRWLRTTKETQAVREKYLNLKKAALVIQQRFRATQEMKVQKHYYLQKKVAVIRIQQQFRAYKAMKICQEDYVRLKSATIFVQRRFRANKEMNLVKEEYETKKRAVVLIQQRFRAFLHGRECRENYLRLRTSAVVVQQRFRARQEMLKCKIAYESHQKAARCIQNYFRAYSMMKVCKIDYLRKRDAAITIQTVFKATLQMRICRGEYLEKRSAALIIQHRYRATVLMRNCRESYLQLKKSTLLIQRIFRANQEMMLRRNEYLKKREAVTNIQRRFRANCLMKCEINVFVEKRKAAVKIQRWYRATKTMQSVKANYLKMKNSAIIIQNRFRATKEMKLCRNEFIQLRTAAVTIQKRYRAQKAMIASKENYLRLKQAAILIQRRFRANKEMRIVKRHYEVQKTSAIIIQQHYKAYKLGSQCKKNYLELKKSTIVIQRKFRALLEMRKCKEEYETQRNAALVIQARFRALMLMKTCREEYLRERKAAIVIQNYFRATQNMKICRDKYLAERRAAVVIQNRYRAVLLMRVCRERYIQLKKCVINVQNIFRANKKMIESRSEYLEKREIVIRVQKRFRANCLMKYERNSFIKKREAAIKIQRWYRSTKIMQDYKEDYLKLKNAVTILQNRFRATRSMKLCRKKFIQLREATLTIQQRYRAHMAMKMCKEHYSRLKQAALIIQRRFRANRAMRVAKRNYEEQRKSATIIQQHFKAFKMGKESRENYVKLKKSTIFIQRKYKAILEMRRCKEEYEAIRNAALIIQTRFRALTMMKSCREKYLRERTAAIVIQTYFRATQEMKICKEDYLRRRKAVITIQTRYLAIILMRQHREQYLLLKNAAILVQRRFRANRTMASCRDEYQELKRAALNIQRRFRANRLMKLERIDFLKKLQFALVIQRWYRATKRAETERGRYLMLRNAAIIIQNRFRANQKMEVCRNSYVRQRAAAVIIQRRFRALKAMKNCKESYVTLKNTVITIQRRYRAIKEMQIIRRNYQRQRAAAIIIQQRFRAYKCGKECKENYEKLRKYVVLVQQKYRATREMRKCLASYENQRNKAIVIQRIFRANKSMQSCRDNYLRQRKAAITIQKYFRATLEMNNCRRNYMEMRESALAIQKRYRALQASKKVRENYLNLKKAAVTIQRKFRANRAMKVAQKELQQKRQAALVIQKHFRGNKKRQEYIKIKNAVSGIQKHFRGYVARKEYWKKRNAKKTETQIRNDAATKIQSVWRGYRERSKAEEKMVQIKERAQHAQKNARKENSIGSRIRTLTDYITGAAYREKDYVNIAQYQKILDSYYEIISKYCPTSCIGVAYVHPVRETLYNLLLNVNRSEPHMAACVTTSKILAHLLRCPKNPPYEWELFHAEAILEQFAAFCDKNEELFGNLCILMQDMFQDPIKRTYILECVPGLRQKLNRVRNLVIRKINICDKKTVNINNVKSYRESLIVFDCILETL